MPTKQAQLATTRRFSRPSLRQASVILPRTGERVRRTVTLRDPALFQDRSPGGPSNSFDALLDPRPTAPPSKERTRHAITGLVKRAVEQGLIFVKSTTCQNILKCSLAYLVGSLATFVAPIAALIGKQDGKHIVATVTVYFHPARSAGSMFEATLLALLASVYAALISFSSMAISAFFGRQNLLVVGHIIVLIVFCGGGLGIVGWLKQRLGHPTINVACSLTSLAIITVLTKEGAVQDARISHQKVTQVMIMVLIGIVISAVVSLVIKPVWATQKLQDDLVDTTDAFGDVLTAIARSFLTGSDDELQHPAFVAASARARAALTSLSNNLVEARYEHYVLGTEKQYWIEARLVKCLQRLALNIGGIRSAAETQFDLLAQSYANSPITMSPTASSPTTQTAPQHESARDTQTSHGTLRFIGRAGEQRGSPYNDDEHPRTAVWSKENALPTSVSTSQIFSMFIDGLGPSMKSLAYTLKQLLDELPFEPGQDRRIALNDHFKTSLLEAIQLFSEARKKALLDLYKTKELIQDRAVDIAADFEEVAASCGYFSSSLQDFAEDMLDYLDILYELKNETEKPRRRTWKWTWMWQVKSSGTGRRGDLETAPLLEQTLEHGLSQHTPHPGARSPPYASSSHKATGKAKLAYHIWRLLGVFRRDDIKFAIKVGAGAAFYAMFSFISATRPWYSHWRGEWGLLSYMLVCSMTIGASNTTGYQRFLGTCIGALLAVAAWIISAANAYILAVFGWLASVGCFFIILAQGKGPMGRFILLTYNLSALYAYSLSVKDDENDDDEGGIHPEIWEIVLHRTVAVLIGCIWGIIVTRFIWPISARRKLKDGLSVLWLRMGLVWKRDPLTSLVEGESQNAYMNISEETELNQFLSRLYNLRSAAASEFDLKGPFPSETYNNMLESTSKMLDAFHAMNVVMAKEVKATPGETEVLKYTTEERMQLSLLLASSMKIEYPLNDALPSIDHTRDRLLAKSFQFRQTSGAQRSTIDEDFELLYVYALVTAQLAKEISNVSAELERLYGVLDEDLLKLQ